MSFMQIDHIQHVPMEWSGYLAVMLYFVYIYFFAIAAGMAL